VEELHTSQPSLVEAEVEPRIAAGEMTFAEMGGAAVVRHSKIARPKSPSGHFRPSKWRLPAARCPAATEASAVPLLQSTLCLSILLRFHLLAVLPRAEVRPGYLRGFAQQRDHK
jgi:hypothetical protein